MFTGSIMKTMSRNRSGQPKPRAKCDVRTCMACLYSGRQIRARTLGLTLTSCAISRQLLRPIGYSELPQRTNNLTLNNNLDSSHHNNYIPFHFIIVTCVGFYVNFQNHSLTLTFCTTNKQSQRSGYN